MILFVVAFALAVVDFVVAQILLLLNFWGLKSDGGLRKLLMLFNIAASPRNIELIELNLVCLALIKIASCLN